MSISIIVFSKENYEWKDFPLGSFSSLYSQINEKTLEKYPVFNNLLQKIDSEDDSSITGDDISNLNKEFTELLHNTNPLLNSTYQLSFKKYLDFIKDKNFHTWQVTIK